MSATIVESMLVAKVDGVGVPQRAQEQAGADQQHQAHRDLKDHERAPPARRADAGGDGAAFVAKRRDRVAAQRVKNRRQAGEDAARRGHGKGERQHAVIDVEGNLGRNPGEVEERRTPPGEQQPAEAADERQQHRFGQPLADQARAAGADRRPDRRLAPP